MEKLIEAFGIDAKLITTQVINFVVLTTLLWYLLYRPVLKIITERENRIKQGLADAEEAKKTMTEADNQRNAILSKAQTEAEEIGARAKDYAQKQSETLMANAQEKVNQLMSLAQKQAEEVRLTSIKDSEAEIAKMALLATEKLIKERLN